MSLDPFYREVRQFLASSDAEVLVISGKWGVGKTFGWNKALTQARGETRIALKSYAYVSLFGLANLDEVRSAMFQNTVGSDKAGIPANMTTLEGAVKSVASSWRAGAGWARLVPMFGDYAAAIEKVGFFSVRNQIICIDDLERKSASLAMRDMLGLITYLREQRGCKVVVLLNDEKLAGDDEEYRSQLEKVADVAVRFDPTPKEAADIGVDPSTSFHEKLHADCVALGIVNIRTIKKAERIGRRLEEELRDFDRRVLEQAVHSATLFTYAKHQPDSAPNLDFIRNSNPYEALFLDDGQADPHAKEREFLRSYGFQLADDLDQIVLAGVENGHFDIERLRAEAAKLQEQFQNADDTEVYEAAWALYHDSFDDDADQLIEAIIGTIREKPQTFTPMNLSGAVTLLREIGWDGDYAALIQSYVDSRQNGRDFWDLSRSSFNGHVTDEAVRAAFAQKLQSFPEVRDLASTLIRIGQDDGWSRDDLPYLAQQDVQAFYDVFKELRGDDLRSAIAAGLGFRNIGNADDNMKVITNKVVQTLQLIGRETPLNMRRVMQKGVDVPPVAENDTGQPDGV